MRTIANILWVVVSGIWTALMWLVAAAILAVTVVGLPFARQCLKLAQFTLWPFGRTAIKSPNASSFGFLGNLLWLPFGLLIAAGYLFTGVIQCITVIGIPFGVQSFKFAGLAMTPFGREIVTAKEVTAAVGQARQAVQEPTEPPPPALES